MATALQGTSKALGLANIGFGYVLAGLYITGFGGLDWGSRLALMIFLGGMAGSALVIIDPVGPLLALIIRIIKPGQRYELRNLALVAGWTKLHDPKEKTRYLPFTEYSALSSPYLAWSRAKITGSIYLILAILLAWWTGRLEGIALLPSSILVVGILIILAKLMYDLWIFLGRVAIVSTYESLVFAQHEKIKQEDIQRMRDSLERQAWVEAQMLIPTLTNIIEGPNPGAITIARLGAPTPHIVNITPKKGKPGDHFKISGYFIHSDNVWFGNLRDTSHLIRLKTALRSGERIYDEISMEVPQLKPGLYQICVSRGDNLSNPMLFTIESPAK